MSKHTPGPWEAKGYWSNPDTETLVWDKDAAICHVFPRSEMATLSEETRRANARLIAAAPDLLDALQAIVREPQGKTVADNAKVLSAVIRQARAAIAKATKP